MVAHKDPIPWRITGHLLSLACFELTSQLIHNPVLGTVRSKRMLLEKVAALHLQIGNLSNPQEPRWPNKDLNPETQQAQKKRN